MARKKSIKQIPIEGNNRKAKEENKMVKNKELADTLNLSLEQSKELKSMAFDMILSVHDGKLGKEFEIRAFEMALRAHEQESNILKAKYFIEKSTPEECTNEDNDESGMEGLGALFG